ncbi:hypothetical protein LVJ82_00955 [Vitreoscilla massiliensis]|uniref:Uncharacterized protein n=1 Tax=Vitreoscilla massiliensis TaxID=1689272 RepID=A0ABY4E2U2_9NEIS|nr:hypothetical protein [Vitreoscilla massiliensis]UOO89584.1 hypothetical protein LVJ82_00955 [Vitreoscilla massiliensis]
MAFKRRLGAIPTPDGEKQVKISQAFYGVYTGASKQQLCLNAMNTVCVDLLDLPVLWFAANQETGCYKATTIGMYDLVNCDRSQMGTAPDLSSAFDVYNSSVAGLKQCDTPRYIESTGVSENSHVRMSFGNDIKTCVKQSHSAVTAYQEVLQAVYESGHDVAGCRSLKASVARDIPCEYYPVPIPPKPVDPTVRPCPRFPSHRLPLQIRRRRIEYDAALLPLPFQCSAIDNIPILKSYIMLNTVTASVDGLPLELLSASVTTDMSSFCWQATISLYPDDFAKINMDGRAPGGEAEVTLTINGEAWIFIAEDYSDSRSFGKKTFTVKGRSLTAKLTGDYAASKSGTIQADLYARQIADQQLQYLPFTIKAWDIADWFIPAGSYNITDKKPMDNLIDIATAAGGFVYSDPAKPEITFKPRWPAAAWEVNKASASVTIPDSVIAEISGQKRVNKRCTSVFVWADHEAGGKGADVYRTGTDRTDRASAQVHALYTDLPVHRAAGVAALSDTGVHKTETVKLPWSTEYSIPRANVGDIWQFNEQSGYWRGVITGVSISVDVEAEGAVVLWQSLTVDRYLDV